VRTRDTMPGEWAATTHRLARVYHQRLRGSHAANLQTAVHLLRQALTIRTLEVFPDAHRQTQRALGHVFFADQRWAEAYDAYAAALAANDRLYQATATPSARQVELSEMHDVPSCAAYCLARLKRPIEAINVLERSKARAMSEALARREALLQQAHHEDQLAFHAAGKQVGRLEAEARAMGQPGSRDFLEISTDLRNARETLAAVVVRIRAYLPDFVPDSIGFSDIGTATAMIQQPLVYLLTTRHGSLAFILLPDAAAHTDVSVVWLNDFTKAELDAILFDSEQERRYLFAVSSGDSQLLLDVLNACWSTLDTALMAPLNRWLRSYGYQRATLIPVGNLSLLPLHALNTSQMRYALAPSARALRTVQRAAEQRETRAPTLLGVGNSSPHLYPLPFAQVEVATIAHFFPMNKQQTFYGNEATLSNVRAALGGTTHLHFACHGTFDIVEPLHSALILAGEDTLSLRMLLDSALELNAAHLAVLSACQSGIIDFRHVPDEAIGFPAGFMQAGVPGVVSTLWPVVDPSTALLLVHFHRCHLEQGLDPADSLAQAQEWLRTATAEQLDLAMFWQREYQTSGRRDVNALRWARYYRANPNIRPFAHPYYWAAFYFSGMGVRRSPQGIPV
jgi:CHAT domain-containing protein